jgi:hypothetical protein
MAGKLKKTQIEMAVLGALVAGLLGVLAYMFLKPEAETSLGGYQARKTPTDFSKAVFDNPEYYTLSTPVKLPLEPGPAGRPNPFEPF